MVMADIIQGTVRTVRCSPDGKKFLVIVPVQSAPVPLTILQNWTALAKSDGPATEPDSPLSTRTTGD